MSVDSRTGLVQVLLVNVLILHKPIIIILIQGMVVNVLAPSDKVISSTTWWERLSWRQATRPITTMAAAKKVSAATALNTSLRG